MRLPLTVAAVACLAAAHAPAAAQTRAAGWVSVYGASDGLVVVSPQVSAKAEVRRELEVSGGYEADVISAASVDVQTAASPRGYREVRHGLRAGATYKPTDETRVSVQYTPSWEPDYQSHAASVSASRELADGRLTAELAVRAAVDEVGRTGAARDTWLPLRSGSVDLGLAWIFGPRTLGQLTYEPQVLSGFQSSPYRFVRVWSPGALAPFGVTEAVPSERVRHALGASLRHSFAPRWYATVALRLYRDSWEVTSHTEELELSRTFGRDRVVLGLSGRVYGQSAASFYEPRYVSLGDLPRYRTADKLLARAWSGLGGVRASFALGPLGALGALRLTAKLELYHQRFFDFLPLSSRQSVIGSLGLATEL